MSQENISSSSQRTDASSSLARDLRAQRHAERRQELENVNTEQETTAVSEDEYNINRLIFINELNYTETIQAATQDHISDRQATPRRISTRWELIDADTDQNLLTNRKNKIQNFIKRNKYRHRRQLEIKTLRMSTKPHPDSKNISSAFTAVPKLAGKKNYREWNARIIMACRALGREDLLTTEPAAASAAEISTRDGLLNAIVGTLPPEIYGMHIMETSVVKLVAAIKKEYELLTLAGRSMSQVSLFEIRNQYPHIKQFGEALIAMKTKIGDLKIDGIVVTDDTKLAAIKYITPKQYEYVLLNYENRIKTYNLTQADPADHKTLDPIDLINELASSFEEYREKTGAKIFENFGDRPPQYHPYFAPRGNAGSVSND